MYPRLKRQKDSCLESRSDPACAVMEMILMVGEENRWQFERELKKKRHRNLPAPSDWSRFDDVCADARDRCDFFYFIFSFDPVLYWKLLSFFSFQDNLILNLIFNCSFSWDSRWKCLSPGFRICNQKQLTRELPQDGPSYFLARHGWDRQ